VLDQHTGRARSPHSLSGGETVLASLALALGLADVGTAQSGGITLDTLIVDEPPRRGPHDRPHHPRRRNEGAELGEAIDHRRPRRLE
jgi:hypothetical protein